MSRFPNQSHNSALAMYAGQEIDIISAKLTCCLYHKTLTLVFMAEAAKARWQAEGGDMNELDSDVNHVLESLPKNAILTPEAARKWADDMKKKGL